MQHSPVVDTGMLAIPNSEGHAHSALPPPHDLPLPDEVAKPPDRGLPEQIQAPAGVRGQMELPWGEALQHVMWHVCPALVCMLESETSLGEVHGHLPDIPNLYPQDPIVPEHIIIDPKALVHAYQVQRPVLNKGAHASPELWPSLGIIITKSDTCTRASVLLKGEQNYVLLFEGSEQYAAPCTPQISPMSVAILLTLKPLKLPNPIMKDLYKPGRVREAANVISAPTKDTASIELAGTAKRATTMEPKALEPRVGSKAGCRLYVMP